MDPHCFDADPEPDPAQNLDADPDPDPDPGGGGRSAKNVHPPWQNPRYAPADPVSDFYLMRIRIRLFILMRIQIQILAFK